MKIGFSISKSSHGGGERMQQMLLREFKNKGYEVIIFTWEDSSLNEFNNSFRKIILKRKNGKIQQFIYEVFQINKEIRSLNLDCLLFFGANESFMLSSFLSGTKSISSLRVDPKFPKNNFLTKFRRMLSFSLSDGIIFQTETVQYFFLKNIIAKSIVIPNPIIDDHLPNEQKNRKNKIVSVGRLASEKNFALLINAFSNIRPDNYTLHIYGDGPLKSYLQELIAKLRMEGIVFLEGQVNRVVDEIADAEIFVLCSDSEGMPNALIEAMAMGLACISTNFPSGAAEYLINDKINGLLVPVGGQKELEESLELLIKDKVLRNNMGENAIKVRDLLKKEVIIDEWLSFIQKTVNQKEDE